MLSHILAHNFVNEDGLSYSHPGYRVLVCSVCGVEFHVANTTAEYAWCGMQDLRHPGFVYRANERA